MLDNESNTGSNNPMPADRPLTDVFPRAAAAILTRGRSENHLPRLPCAMIDYMAQMNYAVEPHSVQVLNSDTRVTHIRGDGLADFVTRAVIAVAANPWLSCRCAGYPVFATMSGWPRPPDLRSSVSISR